MPHPIPLIRAAAIAPILIWMHGRGLRTDPSLQAAGLPVALLDEPERPIALHAAIRFFATAAESHGPDLGCRVVSDTSVAHLASLGRVALGARTPREALTRLMRAYPHHSSHELFAATTGPDGLTVRHGFTTEIDETALHLCHQYIAALVRMLTAGCGDGGPRLDSVRITPHPKAGLDHLRGHFDVPPAPSTDRTLTLTLADAVVDRPYRRPLRDRGPLALSPIRGDGTVSASLRAILPGMIDERAARLSEVARLAGTSVRTLQRRLAEENTSLSRIIDGLRRESAMSRLAGGHDCLGLISAELGYSDQSSLSRSLRRWYDARLSESGG
jgi:AraC-like DNA-binding protein